MRTHTSMIGSVLIVAVLAVDGHAQAPQTFNACYVPDVGALYLIGLTGLPTDCLSQSHIPITWTEGLGDIADGSITTPKLADNAVTTAKITAQAVTTSQLASGAVTTTTISDQAVSTSKIATGAVTGDRIATGSVTGTHIANGSISTADLAANSVGTNQLANASVTSPDIATGAVSSSHIASGAVTSYHIANGTITSTDLASSVLTASALAAIASDGTLQRGVNAVSATRTGTGRYTVTFGAGVNLTTGYYFVQSGECNGRTHATALSSSTLSVSIYSVQGDFNCAFKVVVF